MDTNADEWTVVHKGILGVVLVALLMLIAQIVRYFINK